MYEIEFNGETSTFHNLKVQHRPDIPAPVKQIETIDIPGRDEPLTYIADVPYADIIISIEMGFMEREDRWGWQIRDAKNWLTGAGDLKLSDDPGVFYKVKNVELREFERTSRRIGQFEAQFVCSPYTYVYEGQSEKSLKDVAYNPYALCHPVYKITGNGRCTLTVNGKTLTAEVGQNMTVDTERMLAYRQDGMLQNTAVTGNYEDLYLIHGDNQISVSSGFSVTVIPGWRCL